ncbi:MAG: L,D-transpeptidase [Gammaproteobacteria bacterium]
MHYRLEYRSAATAKQLRSLQPYQLTLVEKLNRADRKHLPKLFAVVFPERWTRDELAYSPLSQNDLWAAQYSKAIVIDQPLQAFGAYENGHLVRWGPVSTGRRSNRTPSGLFHLNWRSRGRHSTVNPRWYMPWYFNLDNAHGLSMHAYDLPGYPASHACVRLLESDAQWLFYWGEPGELSADRRFMLKQGTPVLIIGRYDFTAPAPWRSPAYLFPSPNPRAEKAKNEQPTIRK